MMLLQCLRLPQIKTTEHGPALLPSVSIDVAGSSLPSGTDTLTSINPNAKLAASRSRTVNSALRSEIFRLPTESMYAKATSVKAKFVKVMKRDVPIGELKPNN